MKTGKVIELAGTEKYVGKTLKELSRELNKNNLITEAEATKLIHNEVSTNYQNSSARTVRLNESGSVIESLPLTRLNFDSLVSERWESSDIYRQFNGLQIALFVYEGKGHNATLKHCIQWEVEESVLNSIIKHFWINLKNIVLDGVKLIEVTQRKGVVTKNNLPKMKDNHYVHIRPRGHKWTPKEKLPNGDYISRQAYWISATWINSVIKKYESSLFDYENISSNNGNSYDQDNGNNMVSVDKGNNVNISEEGLPYIGEITEKENDFSDVKKEYNNRETAKNLFVQYVSNQAIDVLRIKDIEEKLKISHSDWSFILKDSGYHKSRSYILKNNFKTYSNYIRHLISSAGFLNTENIEGNNTQYFKRIIERAEQDSEIIMIGKNEYITLSNLERQNIGKRTLLNFCRRVREYTSHRKIMFFTIKSLKKSGFLSDLFAYGFDDVFFSSLLRNSSDFGSNIMDGNIVFSTDPAIKNTESLLVKLVIEKEKVEVTSLIEYFDEQLSVEIDESRVKQLLNNSNLYYNKHMDAYYSSIEVYYEEVF